MKKFREPAHAALMGFCFAALIAGASATLIVLSSGLIELARVVGP